MGRYEPVLRDRDGYSPLPQRRRPPAKWATEAALVIILLAVIGGIIAAWALALR